MGATNLVATVVYSTVNLNAPAIHNPQRPVVAESSNSSLPCIMATWRQMHYPCCILGKPVYLGCIGRCGIKFPRTRQVATCRGLNRWCWRARRRCWIPAKNVLCSSVNRSYVRSICHGTPYGGACTHFHKRGCAKC